MIAGIETRLGAAETLLDLPKELGDPAPVLRAAKEFVGSGGVGYGLFLARKPR